VALGAKTGLGLALLAALACWGYTFVRGTFSCGFDTSYCATSYERLWQRTSLKPTHDDQQ